MFLNLCKSWNIKTCTTTRSLVFFISVECGGSTYGTECNELCGHCVNNETCYHVNGSCANGCAAGWENDVCKKSKHLLIHYIWITLKKYHRKHLLPHKKNGLNKKCYRTWRYFAPLYASSLSFIQSVNRVTLDWCVRMNAVPIAWILYHVITWQGHVTADVKMAG